MEWAVAFAPRMRISIVQRRGLVLDTRYVPAAPQPASGNPCLYLVRNGTLRWQAAGAEHATTGPTALVVSQEHLEGGDGRRSLTYQTDAEHFTLIEIHLDEQDTLLRAGPDPIPVSLGEHEWSLVERVCALGTHDDESLIAAITRLLDALAQLAFLSPGVAVSAARPDSPMFRLLWRALRPIAENLDLLTTVRQIGDAIDATPHEVDTYVRKFLAASGLVGAKWRPASRHLRLKMAVIMLSADDTSAAEVACVIGYGSADAMLRAFRDAGLPSPGAVRTALRANATRGGEVAPAPATR